MKFTLLGTDQATLELARAILADPAHELTAIHDPCDLPWQPGPLAERIAKGGEWATLLSGDDPPCVLVARGQQDDDRADQLRKLAQARVPLVVAHPVHGSMLIYYELEMIRAESQGLLLPYNPAAWHPVWEKLAEWVERQPAATSGEKFAWAQLLIERTVQTRRREVVLAHFARDVQLARTLVGELTHLSAMASGSGDPDYANLMVQMSGPGKVLVRWNVAFEEPATSQPTSRATLTLVGQNAKATIRMPAHAQGWSLTVESQGLAEELPLGERDLTAEHLARIVKAVGGSSQSPTWMDACRTMELADAVDRSIERRRTIELHYDEHTEQDSFKGIMSGAGCFLLLGAILAAIVGSAAGNFGVALADIWPFALLGLLVVFLLLQLLRLVYPHSHTSDQNRDPPTG